MSFYAIDLVSLNIVKNTFKAHAPFQLLCRSRVATSTHRFGRQIDRDKNLSQRQSRGFIPFPDPVTLKLMKPLHHLFICLTLVSISVAEHQEGSRPGATNDRANRVTQLERLIRDMDSDVYQVREPAFRRIGAMILNPDQSQDALKALAGRLEANPRPSRELRERILTLIAQTNVDWSEIAASIRQRMERDPMVTRTHNRAVRILQALSEDRKLRGYRADFDRAAEVYGIEAGKLKARGVPKNDPEWQAIYDRFMKSADAARDMIKARTSELLRRMRADIRGEMKFEFGDDFGANLRVQFELGGNLYSAMIAGDFIKLMPLVERRPGENTTSQTVTLNGADFLSAAQMTALGVDPQNSGRVISPAMEVTVSRAVDANGNVSYKQFAHWQSPFPAHIRGELLSAYPRHSGPIGQLPRTGVGNGEGFDTLLSTVP